MIPSSLITPLAVAADTALLPVLQHGATAYGQAPPTGEVGFVAAAVLGGVPAVAHAWRPILQKAGYRLLISGVFCHQTPRATFTDSSGVRKQCELADLLVVVDDMTGVAPGRRWAALIQAKMAASGGGKVLANATDLRQLDLFTRWPPFTLSGGYQPAPRDFSTCHYAGTSVDCGRYGLIGHQPIPDWYQQAPARRMPVGGHQLGSFLAHMVESGQSGFGREATGNGDDWSRTVDELMTVTYAGVFNYVTGFGKRGPQPRGQVAMAYMMAVSPPYLPDFVFSPSFGEIGPPSGGRPDYPEEEGPVGDGISVLRIGIAHDPDRGE